MLFLQLTSMLKNRLSLVIFQVCYDSRDLTRVSYHHLLQALRLNDCIILLPLLMIQLSSIYCYMNAFINLFNLCDIFT